MKKMYKYVIGVLLVTVLFIATGYVSYEKGLEEGTSVTTKEMFLKLGDTAQKNGFDFGWN